MNRREFGLLASLGIVPNISVIPEVKPINLFAKWWNDLNCWEWPKEWGDPPERFQNKLYGFAVGIEMYECRKDEYHQIMKVMEQLAGGHKEVLRYGNVERSGRMTEEQFEKWWRESYS